jgi:flotillin
MTVARETLEGNLRGVLATLTPEEVNHDREKFARELLHEADHDLARLGLELDTLKIQHVSDDKGYLDSMGRRQTAELLKKSRISEADNQALSAERSAENWQNQELAKITAQIETERAEADAARRIIEAQTRKTALVAEARGEVSGGAGQGARHVEVQRARIGQVRLQLVADRVKPAEAQAGPADRAGPRQRGALIEDGRATARAIRSLGATWADAGDSARQIFVAQKLTKLVGTLMSTVGEIPVDKVTFIDKRAHRRRRQPGGRAAVTSEQLKQHDRRRSAGAGARPDPQRTGGGAVERDRAAAAEPTDPAAGAGPRLSADLASRARGPARSTA